MVVSWSHIAKSMSPPSADELLLELLPACE